MPSEETSQATSDARSVLTLSRSRSMRFKMHCNESPFAPDQLWDFAAGKFDEDSSSFADISLHLTTCPICSRFVDFMELRISEVDTVLSRFDRFGELSINELELSPQTTQQLEDIRGNLTEAYQTNADEARPATDSDPFPGYRILEELTKGGMGVVYSAIHQEDNHHVAIKTIRDDHLGDEHYRMRFEREVRIGGNLQTCGNHDNVVTFHFSSTSTDNGKRPFLVMELLKGHSLGWIVRNRGRLKICEVSRIIAQAATALSFLHKRGFIHRDVKPDNLFWQNHGEEECVKLLDFGVTLPKDSTILPKDPLNSQPDTVIVGTRAYMPEEQAQNPHTVGVEADIFALGRTAAVLLTGRRAESDESLMSDVINTRLDKANAPVLPRRLAVIIDKMQSPHASNRFHNAADVASALKEFAKCPKRPPRLPSVAAAVMLIVSLFFCVPWRPHNTEESADQVAIFQAADFNLVAGDPMVATGATPLFHLAATHPDDAQVNYSKSDQDTLQIEYVVPSRKYASVQFQYGRGSPLDLASFSGGELVIRMTPPESGQLTGRGTLKVEFIRESGGREVPFASAVIDPPLPFGEFRIGIDDLSRTTSSQAESSDVVQVLMTWQNQSSVEQTVTAQLQSIHLVKGEQDSPTVASPELRKRGWEPRHIVAGAFAILSAAILLCTIFAVWRQRNRCARCQRIVLPITGL